MINRLKTFLKPLTHDGIALAYSGGVDSTLLLAVLAEMQRKQKFPFIALTMQTVLHTSEEIKEATDFAAGQETEHKLFYFNPLEIAEVRQNRTDRCYHCKKRLFTQFLNYCRENGIKYILDGTNADDLNAYRPGRKALKELGVISPLAELGFTKEQIRKMSAEMGLSTASKPSVPCLATRFEYDTQLNDELIKRVASGENFLRRLFPQIKDIRLRVHGNGKLARLEISAAHLPEICPKSAEIAAELKNLGFLYVTLDLEGFRSGSFDIDLGEKQ